MSRHAQTVVCTDGDLSIEVWDVTRIADIARWLHSGADWKRWDAPYLPGPTEQMRTALVNQLYADPWQRDAISDRPMRLPLCLDGAAVGTVSWHWEDSTSGWARIGLVIYDPSMWGNGLGTRGLRMWVGWLASHPDVHRIDLSTWSGNERMLRAAKRVGMREEARLRSARMVDGARYDAVVMGMVNPSAPSGAVH